MKEVNRHQIIIDDILLNMNRYNLFTLPFVLLLTAISAYGQIAPGYYDSTEGKTGDELKVALHEIIKGHTVVSYSGLLDVFPYTDCDENMKIIDIYSNYKFGLDGVCGNYHQEGDCWNREHTWPQSWFKEASGPKSDLFHVYPTDGYVNNRRSSFPYGKVNNPTYTSENGSKLGPSATPGYSGTVFEPIDEYKGDIARSYFYMSVRYYSEDSGWISSDMTDKSEIKPWAMAMLLDWNDQDPVSEKELKRNTQVQGFQGNRNPFIDHPEYARMIWDPNWAPGVFYAITCATVENGTISAPATAYEGSTVTLTATPSPGYELASWTVYKTDDSSTTIEVSSNGTFTMPSYAVTVSATFRQNTTYYAITTEEASHGTFSVSATSALSGTTINLTAMPAEGYCLYAWYVFKTGDTNITVPVENDSFTMPAFPVTVLASFAEAGANADYVKVTSAPNDWSGEYLIVCEGSNVAFNGGLTTLDAVSNTISVTIANNTIAATDATNAAKFTIAATTDGYSIQASSGKYIGQGSNDNGLKTSDTPLVNTISYNDNINIIGSGGAYLRYNPTSGQTRFRYFKSSTYTSQQPIQLFKKTVSAASTPSHIITFHNGNASYTQQVNENEPTALQSNTFTKDGYVFDGWTTHADGIGTYYTDGANVTLYADLDLYAQWDELFSVTCNDVENGSISASPSEATEETTVTLTATPDEGYVFYHWTVTDELGDAVNVTENQFEMPAADVTVDATFVYVGTTPTGEASYTLVTSEDQLVAGKTYLIVNRDNNKALSTTQNNNNRAAAAVSIDNNTIAAIGDNVCELILGGSIEAWTFYDANKNGYLYAAGGSNNNHLKTKSDLDDKGKWTITITDNNASIKAQDTNTTRNDLKYNNSNDIFSCYASGQSDVSLFVKQEPMADYVILANNDTDMPDGMKNTDLISANAGKANVVLYGRTLWKDDEWNTLCLPFNLTINGSILDGAELMKLTNASIEGSTLTLNFSTANSIEAGKPYIIRWGNSAAIENPVFNDVTLVDGNATSVAFDDIEFLCNYSPISITGTDNTMLYLGEGSTLYYPNNDMTIGAFRAYFRLLGGHTAGDLPPTPSRFVLNFNNDVPTGIQDTTGNRQLSDADGWYTVDGRKLHQRPTTTGLFINKGKKVINVK